MAKKHFQAMTSHVSFRNSQGIAAQGSLVRLNRQQVVFEVYNPYSIVQLSEVLQQLSIHQGQRETYSGRAVVTGLLNTGLMLIVSASLVDPWSDLKGLQPGEVLRSFVQNFVSDWEAATERLEKPFQVSVGNLRNYLQELSRWLEHWETEAGIQDGLTPPQDLLDFVNDVDHEIAPRLMRLYEDFEAASQSLPKKYLPYHRAFAQRELHPLMMSSPFMNRAYNKPLGYAGDFEMVRMMLNEPWEGPNTFAKLLNASALRHEAPAAHRNRIELLQTAIKREVERGLAGHGAALDEGRFRIMNLGCGPAVEIRQLAAQEELTNQLDVRLVDFNSETLDHVRTKLVPEVQSRRPQMNIEIQQRSVHELIQSSAEGQTGQEYADQDAPRFDMVYCAGLFDYFRDTTCGFLLELFYSWVKPGGLVLVTNVTPTHSSVAIMGLVLDWNLELRNEQDMLSMAPQLGTQQTYVDRTGVNVFLEIRKPTTGEANHEPSDEQAPHRRR
ncbi:class I SAM-dependent methyltransferase [Roseimaritima ulvae]|uniref:Methyltransferase domain protein n=1 Tax=Roseimaritima ulvae TaxID=980254 RepID=A0A5B9QTK9_9BACT|nr:class I SAM-dependent methyltransferase [Roseimaritima ulvae]QEG42348.1 Methyltransferase domain protein [Roseimaritima ulvae]